MAVHRHIRGQFRRHILGSVIAGLAVAVALAALVGPFASTAPDGLEKVVADHALDREVDGHALDDGPLADYGVAGERVGTGLAGAIGVAVTFGVSLVVFAMIKRARREASPTRLERTASERAGSAPPARN
jgi:hypothetical protein